MPLPTVGAGLLVVGGIINAVPPLAEKIAETTGGKPIVNVLLGVASLITGVILIGQTL